MKKFLAALVLLVTPAILLATRPYLETAAAAPSGSDTLLIDSLANGTRALPWTYYEPSLANPGTNGFILSSTTAGVRSWVAPGAAWSAVTGTPTTLAGYGISDGVSTGGTYANPAWLTSLAWSKLTGTPTTLAGYGITDSITSAGVAAGYEPKITAGTTLQYWRGDKSWQTLPTALPPVWSGLTTNGILQATSSTTVASTLTPSGLTSIGVNTITAAAGQPLSLSTSGAGTVTIKAAQGFYTFGGTSKMGDINGAGNNNLITVDDAANRIRLSGYVTLPFLSANKMLKTDASNLVWMATAGTDYSAGTGALATGILKTTTTTGDLSIAVAADFPTLNQSTTGSAAYLTTSRSIGGSAFNGTADVTSFPSPGAIGSVTPSSGAFTTVSATGQITSTLATGTAPLVIASTTNVPNLNASSLSGATFAAPGAIGGTTPGAITGTTITANTAFAGPHNGTVGATTPNTGAFTTLSASSTVSGSGFSAYLASPPAIGGTAPASGAFTSVNSSTGVHSSTVTGTGGVSYGALAPITLYVKSVTVLTAGAPADIATIAVPSGITRYGVAMGSSTGGGGVRCFAETASGTLASGAFTLRDTASGGGTALTVSVTGPASSGVMTSAAASTNTAFSSGATIYINQTSNSANAGTCSFYITIFPMP